MEADQIAPGMFFTRPEEARSDRSLDLIPKISCFDPGRVRRWLVGLF